MNERKTYPSDQKPVYHAFLKSDELIDGDLAYYLAVYAEVLKISNDIIAAGLQ